MYRIISAILLWAALTVPASPENIVCPAVGEPEYQQSLRSFNQANLGIDTKLSQDLAQAMHCMIFLYEEFHFQEMIPVAEKVVNLAEIELGRNHTSIMPFRMMLQAAKTFSDPNWLLESCNQDENLDIKIDACTMAIKSGHWREHDLAWAYHNRGNGYLYAEDYDGAIAEYDEALRRDPNYVDAYNMRGYAYTELSEYKQAINEYSQALRIDPDDVHAYLGRGYAYFKLGDYPQAITDYDEALRIDPDFADAYEYRAHAYRRLGDYAREVEGFTHLLRLQPNDDSAYNNRAWALYLLGRHEEALVDAEKALSLNFANVAALDTRAHALAALGRHEDALEAFKRAMLIGGVDQVRLYQEALKGRGYDPGRPDGIRRTETREALEACIMAGCRLLE